MNSSNKALTLVRKTVEQKAILEDPRAADLFPFHQKLFPN